MSDEELRAYGILALMIGGLILLAILALGSEQCLDMGTGFCPE